MPTRESGEPGSKSVSHVGPMCPPLPGTAMARQNRTFGHAQPPRQLLQIPGEGWRGIVRLSGSCLRDLVRQFECVFLMLLECRQDLLCKSFQFSVMARALLSLEKIHGLIVIFDHPVHVLLVKGLAVQGLNIFWQPLVL